MSSSSSIESLTSASSSSTLSLYRKQPLSIENRFAYLTNGSLAPDKYITKLKSCIQAGTNNILIEFLTINYVRMLKKKLYNEFLFELKSTSISKENDSNTMKCLKIDEGQEFLNNIHKKIVSQIDRNAYIHLLTAESELLVEQFYHLFKKKFINVFLKPETIKFALNIPRTNEIFNNKQDSVQSTRSHLFQNDIFKVFCPVLFYKSDLNKKKNKPSCLFNTVKTVLPIVSTWLLTILMYCYFRFQMKLDPLNTVQVSLFIFTCLIYGLSSDNKKFKAIILLCLPFLVTNRGRGILIINCYEIATSEILPNIEKNIQFLRSYYECNKKVIKVHSSKITKNSEFYRSIISTAEDFKRISKQQKKALSNKRRAFKESLKNHSYNFNFNLNVSIGYLTDIFESCQKTQNYLTKKCHSKMEFFFKFYIISEISFISDFMKDQFCGSLKNESVCDGLKRKIEEYKSITAENWNEYVDKKFEPLMNDLRIRINFTNHHSKDLESDKNAFEVGKSIQDIYSERFEMIKFAFFDVMSKFYFPFSFVLIIISAFKYIRSYLIKDHYQNYVMGARFYERDENRIKSGKKSVLPLEDVLSANYVGLFDFWMSESEWKLTKANITIGFCLISPILIIMLTDIGLVSLVDYLINNTKVEIHTPNINVKTQALNDSSADMNYFTNRIFENFMSPSRPQEYVTNAHCLERKKWDISRLQVAKKTLSIYFYVILLMTVVGVYFERLRSICAGCVYPNRDEERSIWLYNHILEIRTIQGSLETEKSGSSAKFIFTWIWKNFTYFSVDILFRTFCYSLCCYACCIFERTGFKKFLLIHEQQIFWLLSHVRSYKNNQCRKCGNQFQEYDELIMCETMNCSGIYCVECYYEIFQRCRFCHQPIGFNSDETDCEYYMSDIDSSDSEGCSWSESSDVLTNRINQDTEIEISSFDDDTLNDSITSFRVAKNINSLEDLSFHDEHYKINPLRIKSVIDESLRFFYENIEVKNDVRNESFIEIFIKNEREFKKKVDDYLRAAVFVKSQSDLADFIVWNILRTVELSDYFDKSLLQMNHLRLDEVAKSNSLTSLQI